MNKKQFHIGDVLTVISGNLIALNHITGVKDFLEFMTGEEPTTAQVPRFMDECKPHLIVQFPELDSPQVQFALAEFKEMLKTPSGKKDPKKLLMGWFSKLTSGGYGIKVKEMLDVFPLDPGVHVVRDVVEEVQEKVGAGRLLAIGVSEDHSKN